MSEATATFLRYWLPARRGEHAAYESALNAVPTASSLRASHDLLASEPHVAGTPGDERVIGRIMDAFAGFGLQVERHDIWVLLPVPIDAELEILSPEREGLPVREAPLAEDPDSAHADLPLGFAAFSGIGDVRGEVVYANYGTREDFDALRSLGVEVAGRVVIARYGRNFRGYKAKFAEDAGAAGLLLYIDPKDDGYMQGVPYPEGGYANETSIQRGSLATLPYPGDPLTPFEESTEGAARLDPWAIDLPRIPVQPIGWGAARRIMSQMTGRALPHDRVNDWQGGLPFSYRLEGGADLRVRVMVKQDRRVMQTANVLATLRGAQRPEEKVIIGCHHDAWGHGAGDPLSGLIAVLESARSFSALAERGRRPARTIVFAAWGAEESGIMGSVEWCEGNREDMTSSAVAYINLDMASMGTEFSAAASPTVRGLILDAARDVPQARGEEGQSVYDAWSARGENEPSFSDLGGGSDHVGFYHHLAIPSCGFYAGGCHGVSYHSNYDTLRWYRRVVGEDYASALMITRMTNLAAARLACADLLPLDPARYGREARAHVDALEKRAGALAVEVNPAPLRDAIEAYENDAQSIWDQILALLEKSKLRVPQLDQLNAVLRGLERRWWHEDGLPGRPWFRNLYCATDVDSGYAAWVLPEVRGAIEDGDAAAAEHGMGRLAGVFQRLGAAAGELAALKDAGGGS